ncbi:Bacterial type II secretion system protein F domain protein [Anatilimnocola aggregata]|uniref:Bacterial type II secretion system protein F domain protein n=1 Tax=Anatilimnocola aggregata TaxID=2528021 RepID=A0A517YIG5_9BACT|nr:type II secretion system F family protein [Anatilimnocola aggregata]QDU30006.1 Bacterial type II secretion system protein F domain protein [Anatilimnocola aggregata]
MLTLLIIGASFIGVACLVGGVASVFSKSSTGSMVEDRLDLLAGLSNPAAKKKDDTNLLATMGDSSPFEEWLSKNFNLRLFLQQADTKVTPAKMVVMSLGLAVGGVVLPVLCRVPLVFAPIGLVLGCGPFIYFYMRRARRLAKFAKQLPEALELISRALRAGHSLAAGFKLCADEMGAPIGTEFERCYEAQNLGQPLEDAIEEMTDRVPNLDLRFFATAVILQRQTGGDLAEILDKIGHLVRERYKIYGMIQSLTGEGRLSGSVLLGLPPCLAIVMYRLNPGYLTTLFTDPMGHQMLAGAVVLQFVGALVIRKIVNIKV